MNGLVVSTNKILKIILKKIVNENRTDWDDKLYNVLWAYRTTFKTSIQSTPFRMAFELEAVNQVPDTESTIFQTRLGSMLGKSVSIGPAPSGLSMNSTARSSWAH